MKWCSALRRWTWSSYWTAPTAWGKEALSGRATTPPDWAGSWTSDRTRLWPLPFNFLPDFTHLCPSALVIQQCLALPLVLQNLYSCLWDDNATLLFEVFQTLSHSNLRPEHNHFNMTAPTCSAWCMVSPTVVLTHKGNDVYFRSIASFLSVAKLLLVDYFLTIANLLLVANLLSRCVWAWCSLAPPLGWRSLWMNVLPQRSWPNAWRR